jgi:ferredoxin-NADP reductase
MPAFSGRLAHRRGDARARNARARNPYSLLSPPHQLDAYEIGVRRMEESPRRLALHARHVGSAAASKSRIR